jgi:putative Mn2+ efflux pump MntP
MESRRIHAGIGLLFTVLGTWIAVAIADDWPAYLAAVALIGLGVDAIYNAIRGRRSLISRIGPLP